jgi:hypothetical protein
MKILLLFASLFSGAVLFGGDQLPAGKLVLVFHHMIGKEELVLGNNYTNVLGDTISVRKFKYYLSNFSLVDEQGKAHVLPKNYFLVDEAEAGSKIISIDIPAIKIKQIQFLIGVDSLRNVSGIQEGVLDPLKGMFWTWNSGYVMAKLEGVSPSSATPGASFTYHVGGFRNPMNVLRTVTLDLSGTDTEKEINITADINRWFKHSSDMRIAQYPVCHTPGKLAVMIADNYAGMFSISSNH